MSPSTPIGPRDIRPTPTGRIIVEAATGRMPAYVDTGLNLVHVDDVAEGHLLALEKGRIGETYILGGQNATLREMLGEIARLTGRRPPRIRLPRGPIYPIAYVAEAIAQADGQGALRHGRCARHVEAPDVLQFGQGRARAGLYLRGPMARRWKMRSHWFRERGISSDDLGRDLRVPAACRSGWCCFWAGACIGARANATTGWSRRRICRIGRPSPPWCRRATRPMSSRDTIGSLLAQDYPGPLARDPGRRRKRRTARPMRRARSTMAASSPS